MKTLARLAAATLLAGSSLVFVAPAASATRLASGCVGRGDCCVDTSRLPAADAAKAPRDSECPPPTVPEVSAAVLLPLSAGAVVGTAVVIGRRRRRISPA